MMDATAVDPANNTVIHLPTAAATEKMVSEAELNQRIKNMELMMQDELLRKARVFEEENQNWTKKMEEHSIVFSALEEENIKLKDTIEQMVGFVSKIKDSHDSTVKDYEEQLRTCSKEHDQTREELTKTEASWFEIVKKFERLQEVSELLQHQKQKLLKEVEQKTQEKAEITQQYDTLQETWKKDKESHEQEMKRASVLFKHCELKILSLTDSVAKKDAEIEKLNKLLEDLTGGGNLH